MSVFFSGNCFVLFNPSLNITKRLFFSTGFLQGRFNGEMNRTVYESYCDADDYLLCGLSSDNRS